MVNTVLVLPDGTEVTSGVPRTNAILSSTISQLCNSDTDLTIGSVCAAMLEVKILIPGGALKISAGDEIIAYREEDGERRKIGVFIAEQPTKSAANTYSLTCYDRVSLLDKDLTAWLTALDGWPYTLSSFVTAVCTACGVSIVIPDDLPNADYSIPRFLADNITGRTLLSWCGQIAGRYLIADADGVIRFGWYSANETGVSAGGKQYIFQGSISYEDYTTALIDKVQLQLTENDIGVQYPQDAEGTNVYKITGNYLLSATSSEQLATVAETIYRQLQGITYTPGTVSTPDSGIFHVGDIVSVTDKNGAELSLYVMSLKISGQKATLESTGNRSRDSTSAANNESYGAINSKILEIKKDISGLKITAKETQLSLENGLERLDQFATTIEQTARQVTILVEQGVDKVTTSNGYTFNADGFRVSQSDQDISTTIKYDGTYVMRGDDPMLVANSDGVIATDVKVRNYLIIGNNSRLEDYGGNETALFYVGGESV